MSAPTGTQRLISAGGYEAVVVETGGGLRTLTYEGRDVVAGYAEKEHILAGRGQVLMPWPNRIRDGAYTWRGSSYQLGLSEPSRHNASHGLARWLAWQCVSHRSHAVTMSTKVMAQSGYPWTLELSVHYEVGYHGLAVTLGASNHSDSPAPFAAGMHPYVTAHTSLVDDSVLTLPAQTHVVTDDRLLPIGTESVPAAYDFRHGRRVGSLELDDAYTDLVRGSDGDCVVRLDGNRSVEVALDESWRWVQVFSEDGLATGPRRSLAIEPMTAPADAFNSGMDLITLQPGGSWHGSYTIRAG